jgi:beta-N-acetylhexosaminidase
VKLGRTDLAAYLKRKFGQESFDHFVGHYLGIGGLRYDPSHQRIFLVGDAAGMTDQVMQAVQQAEKIVVAIYAIPSAGRVKVENGQFRASSDMSDAPAALVKNVLRVAGNRTVVVAMGTPYLAQDFPEVQTYMCTFSNAQVSEVSAVKALFGDIAIHGHLPVSIPGIAPRDTGSDIPAR